jgi:uncharacterized protein YydD (DUF2326 family)
MLYEEAGIIWPEGVRKRLEEVESFHRRLVENRRAFLDTELARLERAVGIRTEEVRGYSDRRSGMMAILNSHGALAEYAELQRLQSEETAEVDERQKAHALELAAQTATKYGFQYICCLNSDGVPTNDFTRGFSLETFIRLELTDEDEAGGLLGIRY